jgi:hypothetical protein
MWGKLFDNTDEGVMGWMEKRVTRTQAAIASTALALAVVAGFIWIKKGNK